TGGEVSHGGKDKGYWTNCGPSPIICTSNRPSRVIQIARKGERHDEIHPSDGPAREDPAPRPPDPPGCHAGSPPRGPRPRALPRRPPQETRPTQARWPFSRHRPSP